MIKVEYDVNVSAPLLARADIVVIGGGPSGVAAAIAARRGGKSVTLLEKSSHLGGMGTLANVSVWMDVGNCTGIYREIAAELMPAWQVELRSEFEALRVAEQGGLYREMAGSNAAGWENAEAGGLPPFSPFLLRHYLNQKLRKEGVDLLLHCDYLAPVIDGGRVKSIVCATREGPRAVAGDMFIDCSGDARLAVDAGAEYTLGRREDSLTQPMTLMFQMQRTDGPVKRFLPEGAPYYENSEELPQGRRLHFEVTDTGTLLVNMTRYRGNGALVRGSTEAEIETLAQGFGVADYLQRNGFENYILSHVAPQAGVRQTYNIVGEYRLTEEDILSGRRFDDVIAQSSYPVDIHDPTGKKGCEIRETPLYDIPFRCLIPKDSRNVLVAGRCISATHESMSSLRTQANCYAFGQAAGIGAALSLDQGVVPQRLDHHALQAELARQGVHFQGSTEGESD